MSSIPIPVEVVDDIYSLQAKLTTQQSLVRQLKKDGNASPQQLADEIQKLTDYRAKLAELEKSSSIASPTEPFNRKVFEELLLRKMYVIKSFEIHNGPSGLFDYGPPSCSLKSNVLAIWRNMFVLEEG